MFPKIGVPQNGWFIMVNPINMDDYPYFWKHPYVLGWFQYYHKALVLRVVLGWAASFQLRLLGGLKNLCRRLKNPLRKGSLNFMQRSDSTGMSFCNWNFHWIECVLLCVSSSLNLGKVAINYLVNHLLVSHIYRRSKVVTILWTFIRDPMTPWVCF